MRKYIGEVLSKDSTERNEIIRSVVNTAIDECIKENVLRDFFLKYRKEVVEVGVLGYSAEKHMKSIVIFYSEKFAGLKSPTYRNKHQYFETL